MKKKLALVPVLVFILLLVYHFSLHLELFGDDQNLFLQPLNEQFHGNYWPFLLHRYTTWSSRLVIEFFTLFNVSHPLIWRFLNTLMMTICALLPPFLFNKANKVTGTQLLVSSALFFLIPLPLLNETGWIATSTNYLWVYAMGLLTIFPIMRCYHDIPFKKIPYLLGLFAAIYATN